MLCDGAEERGSDREIAKGEERNGEERQGKHFSCHWVQKAERQN